MRVMVICDYDEDYENLGYRTAIYRLNPDGSLREFYETAPRVEL